MVVCDFELSLPRRLKSVIFDILGRFANRTEADITREDLQSGKPARDPETRAYILRLAWFPISHDGRLISTVAYIVRGAFKYGGDPRDYLERGTRSKAARFGFVRGSGLRGPGRP